MCSLKLVARLLGYTLKSKAMCSKVNSSLSNPPVLFRIASMIDGDSHMGMQGLASHKAWIVISLVLLYLCTSHGPEQVLDAFLVAY